MTTVEDGPDKGAVRADLAQRRAELVIGDRILDRFGGARPLADVEWQDRRAQPVRLAVRIVGIVRLLRTVSGKRDKDKIVATNLVGECIERLHDPRPSRLLRARHAIRENANVVRTEPLSRQHITQQRDVIPRPFQPVCGRKRRVARDPDQQRVILRVCYRHPDERCGEDDERSKDACQENPPSVSAEWHPARLQGSFLRPPEHLLIAFPVTGLPDARCCRASAGLRRSVAISK
jgi:hypothetical protein